MTIAQVFALHGNAMNHQLDIVKIYLKSNDLSKAKYQLLIKKRKNVGLKHDNNHKAFIEYSNDMYDFF